MTPLVITYLISALCVGGIGVIYFRWVRKPAQPKQAAPAAPAEPK